MLALVMEKMCAGGPSLQSHCLLPEAFEYVHLTTSNLLPPLFHTSFPSHELAMINQVHHGGNSII